MITTRMGPPRIKPVAATLIVLVRPNRSEIAPATGSIKVMLKNKAAALIQKAFSTGGSSNSAMKIAIQTKLR